MASANCALATISPHQTALLPLLALLAVVARTLELERPLPEWVPSHAKLLPGEPRKGSGSRSG